MEYYKTQEYAKGFSDELATPKEIKKFWNRALKEWEKEEKANKKKRKNNKKK